MTIQTTLPRVNELGYYEMRLESIGGLGANLCGKLLGELGAVQLGLSLQLFPATAQKSAARLSRPLSATAPRHRRSASIHRSAIPTV